MTTPAPFWAGIIGAMKAKTLSIAKNTMRRALRDLIDPPPSEADQSTLRAHFGDRCAYCGAAAPPGIAHIDHADPRGGNGLGNLLLACPACNGNEKREMGWREFLVAKCGEDRLTMAARQETIEAWFSAHPADPLQLSPAVELARGEAEKAIDRFEEAFNRLRDALES